MGGLAGLAVRSLLARLGRTVLTAAGVALGVGVLVAALATNAGIDRSVDATVTALVGRSDLEIGAFTERGLSDATLAAIRSTPDVAVAAPRIERRTFIAPAPTTGPAVGGPIVVVAIDPATDGDLHALPGTADLAAGGPGGPPRALVSAVLAGEEGLHVGSTVTLLGVAAPQASTVTIAGILPGAGPVPGSNGRTAVITIAAARTIFGQLGYTTIDLRLEPGATVDATIAALHSRLAGEPYVVSRPADIAASLGGSTTDFQATTALLAAVALFVAAFLIFNTLSMTVGERTREVGLLRAAGASRGQVVRFVLTQAVVIGVAGSAAGIVVGVGLAAVVAGAAASVANVPIGGPEVTLPDIALALVGGIGVTLAAALEPAIRAGRISPVDALRARPDASDARRPARLRWLLIVFVAVALAGVAVWPGGGTTGNAPRALAVYAVLLVATLLSPFVLGPLGRLAGLPFAVLVPAEERLARGSATRDRSRTALTVGALLVGLAMIVAITLVAIDARRAATTWLVDVVPGDVVVTSIVPVPLTPGGPESTIAAVPGVARVTPIAAFGAAVDGQRIDAVAMSGADLLADGRLEFVAGDRTAALTALDGGGTVILPRSQADRLGLHVGDTMAFTVGGPEPVLRLRITGIVARTLPGTTGESIIVGWSDATGPFGVTGADSFAVRFAPGTAATTGPAVAAAASQLALETTSLDAIGSAIGGSLDRVFSLFDALAGIAVLVAGLGIVNTLTMNVVERVREIGILRAAGMTRRQIWRMVVVEAGVLGIVGAILGCAAGTVAGVALVVLAGGSLAAAPIEVPWPTIGLAAIYGVAVAMLAAYYPARVASRMSIVRAVQYE